MESSTSTAPDQLRDSTEDLAGDLARTLRAQKDWVAHREAELERLNDAIARDHNRFRATLAERDSRISEIGAELLRVNDDRAELECRLAEVEDDLASAHADYERESQLREEAEAKAAAQREAVAALEMELQEARRENELPTGQLSQSNAHPHREQQLSQELDASKLRVDQLLAEVAASRVQLAAARCDCDSITMELERVRAAAEKRPTAELVRVNPATTTGEPVPQDAPAKTDAGAPVARSQGQRSTSDIQEFVRHRSTVGNRL